jgi:hypothetical protein
VALAGYVFRLAIFVERELHLQHTAVKESQATLSRLERSKQEVPEELTAAIESAKETAHRLEKAFTIQPTTASMLHSYAMKYTCFGPACRLAKRWVRFAMAARARCGAIPRPALMPDCPGVAG